MGADFARTSYILKSPKPLLALRQQFYTVTEKQAKLNSETVAPSKFPQDQDSWPFLGIIDFMKMVRKPQIQPNTGENRISTSASVSVP